MNFGNRLMPESFREPFTISFPSPRRLIRGRTIRTAIRKQPGSTGFNKRLNWYEMGMSFDGAMIPAHHRFKAFSRHTGDHNHRVAFDEDLTERRMDFWADILWARMFHIGHRMSEGTNYVGLAKKERMNDLR